MTPSEIMELNIPIKELITYADDLKWSIVKLVEQRKLPKQAQSAAFYLAGVLKCRYEEDKDYQQISENVRILKDLGLIAKGKTIDPIPHEIEEVISDSN